MQSNQAIELLNFIQESDVHVAISVSLENSEIDLAKIKDLGYAAYLCSTACGPQIIVTDKLGTQKTD
jgi:hypothetical protein